MKPGTCLAVLGAALAASFSCGEVPTLENGIAYITPVLLPSPAVAAGDTLRDSLGIATPLRVRAFGRDSQEITGFTVTFVPTALPADVDIDGNGYLIARDTVRSVQLVGRIGDRLQTSVATLLIVPQPLAIGRPPSAEAGDTAFALPKPPTWLRPSPRCLPACVNWPRPERLSGSARKRIRRCPDPRCGSRANSSAPYHPARSSASALLVPLNRHKPRAPEDRTTGRAWRECAWW